MVKLRNVRLSEMGEKMNERRNYSTGNGFRKRRSQRRRGCEGGREKQPRDVLSWKPSKGEDVKEEEVICCTREGPADGSGKTRSEKWGHR